MKLTLANIKELKRNSDSPLLKRVCNYVIDRWSDYNDKKGIFTDVLHYTSPFPHLLHRFDKCEHWN